MSKSTKRNNKSDAYKFCPRKLQMFNHKRIFLCPATSTAAFGSRLAFVTMTIEVAPGGGRRVCFRLRQTEKERSVTVINVLAETETVNSQGPVVTVRVLRSMPTPLTNTVSHLHKHGK